MPRIRFTADPKLPRDLRHLNYRKGDVVSLTADQCERWIRRNFAEYVPDEPAPAAAAEPKGKKQNEGGAGGGTEPGYKLAKSDQRGLWHLVDASGKQITETPLARPEAEALVAKRIEADKAAKEEAEEKAKAEAEEKAKATA